MQVGQPAVAMGSPFGLRGLTTGVISALANPVARHWLISGALQTDAAINPGNSGGPLTPQVHGIKPQIATESQSNSSIGFAIRHRQAGDPASSSAGPIRRAYLSVDGERVQRQRGAAAGPAAPPRRPGCAGDRITKVAVGRRKTADDVAERSTRKPGAIVEVVVQRDGDSETVKGPLRTQPKPQG